MSPIEMMESIYTKIKRSPTPEKDISVRSVDLRHIILKYAAVFFLVALGAFALAGFFQHKIQLQASLHNEVAQYHWLVLVEGAQLDIDEVGRSLERFPNVGEVSFVSRESAFERLKNDAKLSGHLRGLTPSILPAAWNVRWEPDFAIEKQDLFLAEARALPGVLEVAVNENMLRTIQRLREHSLGVRVLLAGFSLLLVLAGVVIGLRFLAGGIKHIKVKHRELSTDISVCALAWTAGIAFATFLTGVSSWTFLPFGLLVGLLHWAWKQTA